MSKKVTILDRPLGYSRNEIALSAFALLFSEIVKYCESRVNTISELEYKLAEQGKKVGERMVDIMFLRTLKHQRITKVMKILDFILKHFWRTLFSSQIDPQLSHNIEDGQTIYYITDKDPLVNRFISVPEERGSLNCAAFMAGVLEAFLTKTGFTCKVAAHFSDSATAFRIRFDSSIFAREAAVK